MKKTFRSDEQGMALLEFCFILPFFLLLLFASMEITRFIIIQNKVESASYMLANIISQYKPAPSSSPSNAEQISQANLQNNTLPQLANTLTPYNDPTTFSVIVTSIRKEVVGGAEKILIKWQYSNTSGGALNNASTVSTVNGKDPSQVRSAPPPPDTPATFPNNIDDITGSLATMPNNENIVIVEVFYQYAPMSAGFLTRFGSTSPIAAKTLISRKFLRPRDGDLDTLPET